MADLIGQGLGHYEITGLIGEGSIASVYQARHTSISRTVAVKVIESRLARDPDFVRRFKREVEAIAALSHPHIIKLFDFGQHGDLLFLVMELLPGGSLAQLIHSRPLPGGRVARCVDQIASALDHAHGVSIIHRDLRPQNVLFDKQGNAILTDFGIAPLMAADGGAAAYMAPEQWHTRDVDGRADLYALGVIAYEMLARQTPFSGATRAELMHAHVYEPPPPVRTVRPDLPDSIEAVLGKALAKGREARFQSGSALAQAIRVALKGRVPAWLEQGVPPGPDTTGAAAGFPRRRAARRTPGESAKGSGRKPVGRRLGLLTVGLVVIIGVVGLAMLLVSRSGDGRGVTPTATAQRAIAPGATSVALVIPSAERAATITGAPSSTASATPTETPDIPATVAVIVGLTDTAVALFSPTPTSTSTATPSLTPSATPTETPDIPATVAVIVGLTDTAVALFSPTPTSTPSSTPSATPTWTLTPTPSLAPSPTPSATWTPTPTSTFTQTLTATPSFTSTPTSTATPSFTPSATPTATPDVLATVAHIIALTNAAVAAAPATPAATPTFTPRATETQTPTATNTLDAGALAITNAESANLRAGPGIHFVRRGIAVLGDTFPALGRTADGNWVQIVLPDGRKAWVSAGLVLISPPDAPIPVITVTPATPTATPTAPTPTPGAGR